MAGKITEYTNETNEVNDLDLLDVSKEIGGGSYESQRFKRNNITKELIFSGGATLFRGQDATASNYSTKFQDSTSGDLLTVRNDGLVSASGIINSNTQYNQNDLFLIGRVTEGLAVGFNALSLATGTLCVAVGDTTLRKSGVRSTGIGYQAGINSTGSYNFFAGFSSAPSLASGNYNVSLGAQSMTNISSGGNNTMLGGVTGAVSSSSTINSSIALGYNARVNRSNQMVIGASGVTVADYHIGAGIYNDTGSYNSYTEVNMWLTNIEGGAGNTDVSSNLDWVWNASAGTGTGTGGDHVWNVAPAGTTGDAQNTFVELLRLKNDGNINMGNLPTSSAGLAAGDLWNNSGVLNIV